MIRGNMKTLGFVLTKYSYCKVWAWQSLHFNLALVWCSRPLNLLANVGPGGADCLALMFSVVTIFSLHPDYYQQYFQQIFFR